MTTKTKTTKPADSITEQAQKARDNLATATARVTARRDQLAAATEGVEEIRASWQRGDESRTPADLTAAEAVVTYCTDLLAAAEADEIRARMAVDRLNDDGSLAELVRPAIEAAIPGVPVEVWTVKPTTAPDTVPLIRVIQTKAAKRELIDGTISGSVEVEGIFPAWSVQSPLTDELLSRTLTKSRVFNTTIYATTGKPDGETVTHTASITIPSGAEAVPVIAGEPQEWRVSALAQGLTHRVRDAAWSPIASESRLVTHAAEQSLTGSTVGKDGQRRTTASVTLKASPRTVETYAGGRPRKMALASEADDAIRSVLDAAPGSFAGGLGRVESVEIRETTPYTNGGRDIRAEITFLSRVSA